MKAVLAFLAPFALIALPALAQPAASPDPTRIQPGRYGVEPEHTQINFAVNHLGFTNYYGRFSGASGTLQIDPHDPAASRLQVAIPAATISTTSEKLDGELKSADWFDAAKFPQITFVSTRVAPGGKSDAVVEGTLTLHGVQHPATLQVHFIGAGVNPLDKKYTVGFQATGQIKRSAFGVSKYVPMVGDDVTLTLSGAFEKQD